MESVPSKGSSYSQFLTKGFSNTRPFLSVLRLSHLFNLAVILAHFSSMLVVVLLFCFPYTVSS